MSTSFTAVTVSTRNPYGPLKNPTLAQHGQVLHGFHLVYDTWTTSFESFRPRGFYNVLSGVLIRCLHLDLSKALTNGVSDIRQQRTKARELASSSSAKWDLVSERK